MKIHKIPFHLLQSNPTPTNKIAEFRKTKANPNQIETERSIYGCKSVEREGGFLGTELFPQILFPIYSLNVETEENPCRSGRERRVLWEFSG